MCLMAYEQYYYNCMIKVPALATLKRFGPALKVASWTARSSFLLHLDPPVRLPTTFKLFTNPPFYPILVYVSLTVWCVIDNKRQRKPTAVALRLVEYTEQARTANTGILGLQKGFGQEYPQERRKGYSPHPP